MWYYSVMRSNVKLLVTILIVSILYVAGLAYYNHTKNELFPHAIGFPITVSPDGKMVAAVGMMADSVTLYNISTGKTKLLRTTNITDYNNFRMCTRSLVFSEDSKTLYVGGARRNDGFITKGTINLWDVSTGKHLKTFAKELTRGPVILLSPDQNIIAAGGKNNTIRFWDPKTKSEIGKLTNTGNIEMMSYSPDGKMLAAGGGGSMLDKAYLKQRIAFRVWDIKTKHVIWEEPMPEGSFTGSSLAWSSDGKYIAVGTIEGRLVLWDVKKKKIKLDLHDFSKPPHPTIYTGTTSEVHFSPDNKILAAGGYDGINLWNVDTGKLIHHYNTRAGFAFSPDGKVLFMSSGSDKSVVVKEKVSKSFW